LPRQTRTNQYCILVGLVVHTAALIQTLQEQRYQPPKWLTATELQLSDGDGLRFLDFAAVDLSGRHPELHGIEVKISRSDWRNELKKPHKSLAATGIVDRHYLLAGDIDVYKVGEVPAHWGILVLRHGKIHEIRPAPLLIPRSEAGHWGRPVVAAFMRRALTSGDRQQATIAELNRTAEERGYRKGLNAGRRSNPVHARGGSVHLKHNPGRYNLDDGIPLDLP
jgi:hypothetical protein